MLAPAFPCALPNGNDPAVSRTVPKREGRWRQDTRVEWHYSASGKAAEDWLGRNVQWRLRDKCLSEHLFPSLAATI